MIKRLIIYILLIFVGSTSFAYRKPSAQDCRTTEWKLFGYYQSAKVVDGKLQRFETSEELVDTWSANYNFYDVIELRGNWKEKEIRKIKISLFKENEKASFSEKKVDVSKEKPQVGNFKEIIEYPLSENRILTFEISDDKGVFCETRVKLNALD